jgi:hypothetical protein
VRRLQVGPTRLAVPIVVVLGAAILGCSSTAEVLPVDGLLPMGTWGGDSAGMIVGDTAMHLHIACTYGDVSGRVPLDADGRFDVQGSYLLRAYPIAIGPTYPARFVGRLTGKSAVIIVTVTDTTQHVTVVRGPVTITLGQDPRDLPCPICRRPIATRVSHH